ncbi:hypothetical protein F1559_000231 [Cyanidiococcus yangmingshanensis]|uniref:Uncharacterized protein n=1 Tax=Cyanidiococcus yangmingshanensis TaxID=2690220 RepID=A0A7J7IHN5_9RHOD|nr:hypothetical protein F1559_000231 [Cyanidiococcus yangmingshanensis]
MFSLSRLLLAPGKRTIDLILRHEAGAIGKGLTVRVRLSGPMSPGPYIVSSTEYSDWFRELKGLPPYDPIEDARFPDVPPDSDTETHLPIHLRCSSGFGLVRVYILEHEADIGIPVNIRRELDPMVFAVPSIVPCPVELKRIVRTSSAATEEDFDGEVLTSVHLPSNGPHP